MWRRVVVGLWGVIMLLIVASNVADGTMYAKHGREVSQADQPGAFWFVTSLWLIAAAVALGWAIFSKHGRRRDG